MSYFRIFPYSNLAQPRRMLCLHGSVICFSFLYTDIGNLGLKLSWALPSSSSEPVDPRKPVLLQKAYLLTNISTLMCLAIPNSCQLKLCNWRQTLEWSFVTIFCHLIDSCLPCSPCHVIQFYSYFWSIWWCWWRWCCALLRFSAVSSSPASVCHHLITTAAAAMA